MYSFLQGLQLVDTGRLRVPTEKTPKGLTVRVFADGRVYPSQELVDQFKLEYQAKEVAQGNGFDVVDSHEWPLLADYPRMIMFGVTPKTEPKVDLFANFRTKEGGIPTTSVMTQGSVNTTLLDLCKSMGYLNENQKYVDLEVVMEHPVKTENGVAYIPKTIERGEKEGQKTTQRRENVTFYPVNTPENLMEIRGTQAVTGNTNATEAIQVSI